MHYEGGGAKRTGTIHGYWSRTRSRSDGYATTIRQTRCLSIHEDSMQIFAVSKAEPAVGILTAGRLHQIHT